jgi:S1-C subfamily serine protease
MATIEARPKPAANDPRPPRRGRKRPTGAVPPRWRERLLPKTVMGITVLVLAAAIGSAFSGVVLYSYYEYRLNKTEAKVNAFINNFQGSYDKALANITSAQENAKADIDKELEPLKKFRAEGDTLAALTKQIAPSMFFVHTLDESGQASVGSAFAVASDANQTFLVTSYNTVRAATKKPGPDLFVRQGNTDTKVTVYTWQEDKDLALIILPRGNVPKLTVAPTNPPLGIGERVFAASGLGSAGATIGEGLVGDVSAAGIQHDAPIAASFQGGPLLNSDGKIVGIDSRAYAPLNFTSEGMFFAIPPQAMCDKILKCPNGSPGGAGDKR